MKRRYRITPEADKGLDDSQVSRYKDHARLQANYNKALRSIHRRPLYRDPKALAIVLLIVLLTWLIVEARDRDREERPLIEQAAP
jgi:hypothetical protein